MDIEGVFAIGAIFIGLPWVVLHYLTRWRTAATLTAGDEDLLDELYRLAKRLDERMDTVERLVAADSPEFSPARILPDRESDNEHLRELERKLASKEGKAK